ncbi:HD-GYP domain-containing protein [Sporosarcina sp. HYO08]|uniref:HD-GYP domain-containing protein n=1 Tax=Sporosarcina sp. HYO08 TaxID=1759557 RepID=UPI00079AC104|nr:HD domain-containing phosphohydrolase [Sporosarcina sp. HYO08]KXH80572.1 hypothetical protein AU377_07440 [Sporosarcina sp. HYO08]
MYVKVDELQLGDLLMEDIFANTQYTIMRKKTVLSTQHIKVLLAFGIQQVKVEPINGINEKDKLIKINDSFDIKFNEAILTIQQDFDRWRLGISPDMIKLRASVIPLIETFLSEKISLLHLLQLTKSQSYLYSHPLAVCLIASRISMQLGHSKGEMMQIGLAGLLSDCGMAKINPEIMEKEALLTKEAFQEIKKHSIYSFQMIKDSPFLRTEMKLAILQHHERLDGSGYPRSEKMNDISIAAQIIAVADVFHAMTSYRIYRDQLDPIQALAMMKDEEAGKLELQIIQVLEQLLLKR